MVLLIVSIVVILTKYLPGNAQGIAWSRIFYSSLICSPLTPLRQKDGTGVTTYASLAARSSRFVGAGDPVRLVNRIALLSDDSVESSERCDRNLPDLIKGLTKWHYGSVDSIDLAQPKQYKVSPGAHGHESSRDHSAMVTPMVSVQPSVTSFVSDRASCYKDGLSMESDDIITGVPRRLTVSKSAVQTDPRPPVTCRNGDNSNHSPIGRKAAVHRTSTSQLSVSSRQLIIFSQVSHGQTLQKSRPSTASKSSSFYSGTVQAFAPSGGNSDLYYRSFLQPVSLYRRLYLVIAFILVLLAIVPFLTLLSLNRATMVAQLS
ncbi:hypothetical protein E2C01_036500 [Portunus trituberculatus]|uniref:Uncharacterized protein n=1 Tax=Portunus trituberculatus TaxID=210409 RepID=A0A5B7FC85_PORTR|nr:hypothetical protein [Portunus trituberculatus]